MTTIISRNVVILSSMLIVRRAQEARCRIQYEMHKRRDLGELRVYSRYSRLEIFVYHKRYLFLKG